MSIHSNASNVSRRHFLAVAGTAAAATSLAVGKDVESAVASPPPPTPSTYVVTIDVTGNPIAYSAGGKPVYRLQVNPKDKVNWKAKTSKTHHHLAILFLKETPLVDGSGGPVFAVHGSESDESGGIGGTIDSNASGTYEYYVAVFDNDNNRSYSDDPKIIVGTGQKNAEEEINAALDDLRLADAKLSGKPKLQEKLESIEKELERVIDDLAK